MKRLMTTTALMMLTATATFAATGTELREAVTQSLGIYQTDINVDALTDAQVSALYTALNSGNSPAEIESQMASIVGVDGSDDATEIRRSVANALEMRQVDLSVEDLTDAQVSALYTALNSGNSPAEINAQISSIAGSVQSDDATQLRAALANALEMYQVDVKVADLTDEQVVALTLVINSGGSNGEKKGQMESIIMAR